MPSARDDNQRLMKIENFDDKQIMASLYKIKSKLK